MRPWRFAVLFAVFVARSAAGQATDFEIQREVAVGMNARILRSIQVPSVESCMKACGAQPACAAITYVRPTCWLKDGADGVKDWKGCVSAVRRQSASATAAPQPGIALGGRFQERTQPGGNPPAARRELPKYTAAAARDLAKKPAEWPTFSVNVLARVLYVLEVEAPEEAASLRSGLGRLQVQRFGRMVNRGEEVLKQAAFFHERFDMPCTSRLQRAGEDWPPVYRCADRPTPATADPVPVVALQRPPVSMDRPPGEAGGEKEPEKKDEALGSKRKAAIAQRDRERVQWEDIAATPSDFCVEGKGCKRSYAEVAALLYGSLAAGKETSLPVFCAPKRAAKGSWETARVFCSSQWLDTLGGWKPWTQQGKASRAPEPGVLPEYACFGSPHLLSAHMVLPQGGAAGQSGFRCRRRIFRILAKDVEKSLEDANRNIARVCSEMRQQVWGEKYKDINSEYQKWCRRDPERVKKGICLPKGEAIPGAPGSPPLPFLQLSREELLYFFGHREVYCRADRAGLVHFLYNEPWAKTFTCGIARGLVESGPFEEGVQVCALTPFVGQEGLGGDLHRDDLKARLHCWKFNRPTCEELSRDQTLDDIHKSNVFDAYDALRQARRTLSKDAWAFKDLKDAEKLADFTEAISFGDTAKDEGVFGVKEFCRFVGDQQRIQCGYRKEDVARWYELRSGERPEGCDSGVCARGAYTRGYYCGLFRSAEYFRSPEQPEGKPVWICGLDKGPAGRRVLGKARALCVGGASVKEFQSPKGDRGSLQCYERRFRWGESAKSEFVLQGFDWARKVQEAGQAMRMPALTAVGRYKVKMDRPPTATFDEDLGHLLAWAKAHGHTLGHQTSARTALMASSVPIVEYFKKYLVLNPSFGEKAKALNPLVAEVQQGRRFADERWLQELHRELTEAKVGTMANAWMEYAARIHHVSLVLKEAGNALMRDVALPYRHAVVAAAQKQRHWLSRLELHQRARDSQIAERFKGSVFCITDPTSEGGAGQEQYICASSPLLVAGQVEAEAQGLLGNRQEAELKARRAMVEARIARIAQRASSRAVQVMRSRLQRVLAAQATLSDAELQRARTQVKLGWCYGATAGKPVFGYEPLRALSQKNLSSPYLLEVPPSVVKQRRLARLGAGASDTEGVGGGGLVAQMARASRVASRPAAAPVVMASAKEGAWSNLPWEPSLATSHFLKCSRFSYSDEGWQLADPQRRAQASAATAPSTAPPAGMRGEATPSSAVAEVQSQTTDADAKAKAQDAGNKTEAIMNQVGGILGDVIKFVLPQFKDAMDRVKDLASQAKDFYDKHVKKFVDFGMTQWKKVQGVIDGLKQTVAKTEKDAEAAIRKARDEAGKKVADAQRKLEGARDQFHKQEVFAASQQGPAKEKAEEKKGELQTAFKEAERAARETEREAKTLVDGATKDWGAKVKNAAGDLARQLGEALKKKVVDGTGALLNDLLTTLIEAVTKKVSAIVEPNARKLVSLGFGLVRKMLDPVVQAAVSAAAAIPFGIGVPIAVLAQILYSFAMEKLEELVYKALNEVIERLLATVVRGIINPFFNMAKETVLELAYGVCAATFPEICPKGGGLRFSALPAKDRWIERALACPGRPVFDERMYRDARLARARIARAGREMQRSAARWVEGLADRALAAYGYSYDSWVAAARMRPASAMAAEAKRILTGLAGVGVRR